MRHGNLRQSRQGRASPRATQGTLTRRRVEVVRTYLELDDPARFRKAPREPAVARIRRITPSVDEYRALYRDVGAKWYWHDRNEWSDHRLEQYLAHEDVRVWELTVDGASAGYFELLRQENDDVEIAYLGLRPQFIGRGFGGVLLSRAVEEAWAMGGRRVWLHTCTLDSERALPNYLARGFRAFRTERMEVELDGQEVVSERILPD